MDCYQLFRLVVVVSCALVSVMITSFPETSLVFGLSQRTPCEFDAIFNFGDSNSDTGGLSAAFGQAPPPNGETYFHAPAGRYSDGRLVIDFIGFVWQELMPTEESFSRALYTFDIGQNDLTAGYFLNMSIDQVRAYVPDLLDQFTTIIKYIYGEGGRSFWIHNTGPVGCLPYIMDRLLITAAQVDKAGCASPFNEVAQFFNIRLKEAMAQLRKDLPLASITYVDVYSVKYFLISKASKHGFELPLVACCGHGGKYNYNRHMGCGSKIMKNGKQILLGRSCKDPSVRINWDGVHYTEAANKWVFDRIVDGSYSDPPMPLKMACHWVAN
ncbi:GDSL esterase/lipase At3g26430-like isoform X2 [Macadamia integrifolia]|uniref:GDSL esterase/lipase At3g26430-like isoform X2 n=1 Tax=Macadamia integrifolia TaxID=60698 RepID=UPI001C4EE778|nr:GDSL esterase/lipase At3g26430-like isoform X2 [Macadamia integrifolia]